MPQMTKRAMFTTLDQLCQRVGVQPTQKQAEDGPPSSAPGASGGAENEVELRTGELASEVSSELKSRTAATEKAPDAKVEGPKEQQLMIGHESHQVDKIDLPIGSEAKDPGTSSAARVGGEKYAQMSFNQCRAEATKLANEILKGALSDEPAPNAQSKVAAAADAGRQAAIALLQRKQQICKSAMQDASIDADLLIGFFKKAEEDEADEEASSDESSSSPEGASDAGEGSAPPSGGSEAGGDPLAGLLDEAGPGLPPEGAGGPPPGGDPLAALGGGAPPMGGDPGMGGDPATAAAGGAGEIPEEVIQQLLALLAQPQLGQMAGAGGPAAKVASVIQERLNHATPQQLALRNNLAKELKNYVREVV